MAVTQDPAGRRAGLLEEAQHLRAVADGLAQVAEEIEHRLDAVVGALGPPIWSGRAATAAADAGASAREDLRVSAGSLRVVARDLVLAAAMLEWRAAQAVTGPVGFVP